MGKKGGSKAVWAGKPIGKPVPAPKPKEDAKMAEKNDEKVPEGHLGGTPPGVADHKPVPGAPIDPEQPVEAQAQNVVSAQPDDLVLRSGQYQSLLADFAELQAKYKLLSDEMAELKAAESPAGSPADNGPVEGFAHTVVIAAIFKRLMDGLLEVNADTGARSVRQVLRYFAFEHLPLPMQDTSCEFAELACKLVGNPVTNGSLNPADILSAEDVMWRQPFSAELTVALRKLLEAKDAAVRSKLPPM